MAIEGPRHQASGPRAVAGLRNQAPGLRAVSDLRMYALGLVRRRPCSNFRNPRTRLARRIFQSDNRNVLNRERFRRQRSCSSPGTCITSHRSVSCWSGRSRWISRCAVTLLFESSRDLNRWCWDIRSANVRSRYRRMSPRASAGTQRPLISSTCGPHASGAELETQLELGQRIEIIGGEEAEILVGDAKEIARMINGLVRSLERGPLNTR